MSDEITFKEHHFATAFSGSLRFGHTSDFSKLFASSEESDDYIRGILFMGVFVMAMFLVWLLVIIILRCLGKRKVGFWAGQGFERVVDDPEYTGKNFVEGASFRLRPTRVRIWFLLCCAVFILFSILSVTNGLTNLQSTVNTINYNSFLVGGLSREASDILKSIQGVRETAVRIKEVLVTELEADNFCPGNPLLTDSGASAVIVDQANEAIPYLEQLENFAGDDMDGFASAADEMRSTARKIQQETDNLDLTSWQSLLILIPFTIIPAILMSATILAMFDAQFRMFTCFVNWIVFPLFFILVIAACATSTIMVIAAGVNADFCLPKDQGSLQTVDTSVLNIVELQGYPNTTMEYKLAEFYISNCQTRDPLEQIEELELKLVRSSLYLNQLGTSLANSENITVLELHCNRNFDALRLMLVEFSDIKRVVTDAVSRTVALTSCDTIVPIYASTAYDASCDYSITALMWLFMGMLTVAFAGLWMLALRSAYKPTRYISQQDLEDQRSSARDGSDDEMEGDSPMKRQNFDSQSVDDSVYY